MPSDVERAARYWGEASRSIADGARDPSWWDIPAIQRHVNARITGDPAMDWPDYTLRQHLPGRLPLARCLSLGCGAGHLERRLADLGAFRQCDAYDVSAASIQDAIAAADRAGLDSIHYQVADVNTLTLPAGAYDAVWINAALHHFRALEHVVAQVHQALQPTGLLVLNEYVGPARFQFPARQKEAANLCLGLLPARYRTVLPAAMEREAARTPAKKGLRWALSRAVDKAREGDLWGVVGRRARLQWARARGTSLQRSSVPFPAPRDVAAADPSEAVRSDEIMAAVERHFEILERKDWGGNLFQFLFAGIAGHFLDDDPCSRSLVEMVLAVEDTLLACGELESDFVYLVARPRAGGT